MSEIQYGLFSSLLLVAIVLSRLICTRIGPCYRIKMTRTLLYCSVGVAVLVPRILFASIVFKAGIDGPYHRALHDHFLEMLWHSNFESLLIMFIQYASTYLSFGGNVYHVVIAFSISLLTSLLAVDIFCKLNFPTPYVLITPILLSWMRMYAEFVWWDHHDVYIVFFSALFISRFIDYARLPNLKNGMLLGVAAVLHMWISPTNFIVLPVVFVLLIYLAKFFRANSFMRTCFSIATILIAIAFGQCFKTKLSSGIFAPSAVGSQLFTLGLFGHYSERSETELDSLFLEANVPNWYRRCFTMTPNGKPESMRFHGANGTCFDFYDPSTSNCRGPNYNFTRSMVVDSSETSMLALLDRDIESACTKPYLFTVKIPEVSTEFGYEYQKVSAKLIRAWLLGHPIDVFRRSFFTNYPNYEFRGPPTIASGFFVPLLTNRFDFGEYLLPFRWVANAVKVFLMMLIITFHLALAASIFIAVAPKFRTLLVSHIMGAPFSEVAIWTVLIVPKCIGIVIYCIAAGLEGERYWQYLSLNVACISIFFLLWFSRKFEENYQKYLPTRSWLYQKLKGSD